MKNAKKRSSVVALSGVIDTVTGFFQKVKEDRVSVYAAQSSFFIVISAIPFIMLILSLSNLLFPEFIRNVFISAQSGLPDKFSSLLTTVYTEIEERGSVPYASITFIASFWLSSRGVDSMTKGIAEVYGTGGKRSLISETLRSIAQTAIMVFAVLLSMTVMVFGVFIRDKAVSRFPRTAGIFDLIISLRQVVFFVVMVLLFSLILAREASRTIKTGASKENVPAGFKAQLPGAALAVVGWMVYSFFFSLYIEYFPAPSYLYGSLAAVILFMFWVYFCMVILLVGAELNKALAARKSKAADTKSGKK